MSKRIVAVMGAAALLVLILAAPAFARSGAYWSYTVDNAAKYKNAAGVMQNSTSADTVRDNFAISGMIADYPGGNVPIYTGTTGLNPIYYLKSDAPGAFLAQPADTPTGSSPHKNYASTSGKCKVCHAVHGAGLNETDTVGGIKTEKLLRTPVNEACEFCHITNNFGGRVYPDKASYMTSSRSNNQSGHVASHRDAGYYQGCASCHAVHGAQTIPGSAVLKNDPAQGVTSVAAISTPGYGTGWGAYQDPVTNQKEFCQDCHNGVARYDAAGAVITKLDTLAQFTEVFPNCSTAASAGGCHTSVQQHMESHNTQFGVDGSTGRNGRSHVMTTNTNNPEGLQVAWAPSGYAAEGPTSAANGCATCHNSRDQNVASPKWTKFPHLVSGQDLITGYNQVTAIDGVCARCHAGSDATFGTNDGGVGEGF